MAKRNKKGSLDDLVWIVGAIIFLALIILIFGTVSNSINNELQGIDELSDTGKNAANQINSLYSGVIDNSMLFLVIGLLIVTLVLAMLVVIHPIFFVFYFIMLTIVIYVSGVISNIYQKAASDPVLNTMAEQLIITTHILQWLPYIVGVFGFILAIIMYKTYTNSRF